MSVNTDADDLSAKISSAFPEVSMPSRAELSFHKDDCITCAHLAQNLDEYRGKRIDHDVIRLVHQELSHLSPKTWRWLTPDYLRFCLSAEANYQQTETEFFIYHLGPELRFQADVARRLSLLTAEQITCLIFFLEWCLSHKHWGVYCPGNIVRAVDFLRAVLMTVTRTGRSPR